MYLHHFYVSYHYHQFFRKVLTQLYCDTSSLGRSNPAWGNPLLFSHIPAIFAANI